MSIRPTPTAAVPAGDGRLKEVLAHGQNLQAVEPEGVCTGGLLGFFGSSDNASKETINDLTNQNRELQEVVDTLKKRLQDADAKARRSDAQNTKLSDLLEQISKLVCQGEKGLNEE